MKVILYNETTIEEWILEKAQMRRRHNTSLEPFKNPYNLGFKTNFRLVMNVQCLPLGDGIMWPVAPGCDQYSLTVGDVVFLCQNRFATRVIFLFIHVVYILFWLRWSNWPKRQINGGGCENMKLSMTSVGHGFQLLKALELSFIHLVLMNQGFHFPVGKRSL